MRKWAIYLRTGGRWCIGIENPSITYPIPASTDTWGEALLVPHVRSSRLGKAAFQRVQGGHKQSSLVNVSKYSSSRALLASGIFSFFLLFSFKGEVNFSEWGPVSRVGPRPSCWSKYINCTFPVLDLAPFFFFQFYRILFSQWTWIEQP